MNKITVKDIALMAILTALLFVQEQLLSFIPNVQLTFLLIVLFSKKLGTIKTLIIITCHVLLDNLFMSSFNVLFVCFNLIGYAIIPITLNTIFKKIDSNIILGLLGVLYSIIYSWLYIIPNIILLDVDMLAYFIADIPFELILCFSSLLTIVLLYNPLSKVLDNLLESKETQIWVSLLFV